MDDAFDQELRLYVRHGRTNLSCLAMLNALRAKIVLEDDETCIDMDERVDEIRQLLDLLHKSIRPVIHRRHFLTALEQLLAAASDGRCADSTNKLFKNLY